MAGHGEINGQIAGGDSHNDSGYDGYVALEYSPSPRTATVESLKHILQLRDQING